MKTVSIIDSSKLFSELLKYKLEETSNDEFVVKDIFKNYKSLEKLIKKPTDILIVDCETTDRSNMAKFAEIVKNNMTKLIFLNYQSKPKAVRQALKIGATGFLNKSCLFEEVLLCIKSVVQDVVYVDQSIKWNDFTTNSFKEIETSEIDKLTTRELEIIENLSEGFTNKEIGEKLFISSQTVAVHRKNILRKYNAKNVAHLVKLFCNR